MFRERDRRARSHCTNANLTNTRTKNGLPSPSISFDSSLSCVWFTGTFGFLRTDYPARRPWSIKLVTRSGDSTVISADTDEELTEWVLDCSPSLALSLSLSSFCLSLCVTRSSLRADERHSAPEDFHRVHNRFH